MLVSILFRFFFSPQNLYRCHVNSILAPCTQPPIKTLHFSRTVHRKGDKKAEGRGVFTNLGEVSETFRASEKADFQKLNSMNYLHVSKK